MSDRVILVAGPRKEVACVRTIYRMAMNGMGCPAIAKSLNQQGLTHGGNPWITNSVRTVLTHPVYTGCHVWGRTTQKLHTPVTQVSPEKWIQKAAAFEPIVTRKAFCRLQAILKRRAPGRWTDDLILRKLRALLARKRTLTQDLVERTPGMPSAQTICKHFGSFLGAYERIGYEPVRMPFLRAQEMLRTIALRESVIKQLETSFPTHVTVVRRYVSFRPTLYVDKKSPGILVLVCRTVRTPNGNIRWQLIPKDSDHDKPALVCRLDSTNKGFHSFYLMPRLGLRTYHRLKEDDPWLAAGRKLDGLSRFYELAKSILT
jgi:hypothetical protein